MLGIVRWIGTQYICVSHRREIYLDYDTLVLDLIANGADSALSYAQESKYALNDVITLFIGVLLMEYLSLYE